MKKLIKLLKDNGFDVKKIDNFYEINTYTEAGEDWVFSIESEEDFKSFVENFDPEEEFRILYTSGVSGLPKVQELIDDQYWKAEKLNEIYIKL